MAFMKTNTVDITVDGTTYNSLADFGLAIENTDYLGTPVQEYNNLAFVPGRSGPLDLTDAVFGDQFFSYRPISISFGGLQAPEDWDTFISAFRNLFEGKTVQLEFETDPGWYWTGRCSIEDFEHVQSIGMFHMNINYADPYKYKEISESLTADSEGTTVTLNVTRRRVVPLVTTDSAITIEYNGDSFDFETGAHKNSGLVLAAGTNTLVVTGEADVIISYLDGSL